MDRSEKVMELVTEVRRVYDELNKLDYPEHTPIQRLQGCTLTALTALAGNLNTLALFDKFYSEEVLPET